MLNDFEMRMTFVLLQLGRKETQIIEAARLLVTCYQKLKTILCTGEMSFSALKDRSITNSVFSMKGTACFF